MSFVFAAITPHTPLLLPTIGKTNLQALQATKTAMDRLEQDLYIAQPDTLIVLSPHGDGLPDAVTINMSQKYISDFAEFGDLTTKMEWKPDIALIDRIRENSKKKLLPLVLTSSEKLDYGTTVPLMYLTRHLPLAKIVPISTSQLDMKTHFEIGRKLTDEILNSSKRVAVIASADLSHRVDENSPEKFSARGLAFDEKILEIAATNDHSAIEDIDEEWIAEAQTSGAKVLAMFYGMIDEVRHTTTAMSYEKPFGTGYLVSTVKLT